MLSMIAPAVTVAEATAYLQGAGVTGWPETSGQQQQALLRGQRYVASRFNGRWNVQFENDAAPDPIKWAIIEASVVEAKQPGSLSPVSTPATDKVLVQAGKLAWERVKGAAGADGYIPRIAAVEGLLRGLVRSGSTHFLTRA